MKKLLYASVLSLAAVAGAHSPSFAQSIEGRYRVTYYRSNTTLPIRSASVVSVTNQSNVTCSVAVTWKNQAGTNICALNIAVPAEGHRDFCTRPIPGLTTLCDATCVPALNAHEGSAIVGSSSTTGCEKIAVSARTIYTSTSNDSPVDAITDAKIVRMNAGNSGD